MFYLHQHKRIHLEKLREREKHVIRTQKIGGNLSFKYIYSLLSQLEAKAEDCCLSEHKSGTQVKEKRKNKKKQLKRLLKRN